MQKSRKRNEKKPLAENEAVGLLAAKPSALQPVVYGKTDLAGLEEWGKAIAPILKELLPKYPKGTLLANTWEPNSRDWRRVEKEIGGQSRSLRKIFKELKGAPVTADECDAIIKTGLTQARENTHLMLALDTPFDEVIKANLAADGTYIISDSTLHYFSPMGPRLQFASQQVSTGEKVAKGLLGLSIIVEAVGFIGALLGINLPKVDLIKLGNKLGGRTRSRVVFRQIDKLFKFLQNAQKTLAEKLEAIIDFLNALWRIGILSDILAGIFASLRWWEIAGMIVMFGAQLALLANPATGAALAAKKAIAIGSTVYSLAKKGVDFGRLLVSTA